MVTSEQSVIFIFNVSTLSSFHFCFKHGYGFKMLKVGNQQKEQKIILDFYFIFPVFHDIKNDQKFKVIILSHLQVEYLLKENKILKIFTASHIRSSMYCVHVITANCIAQCLQNCSLITFSLLQGSRIQ
jgi:hypothetical protein